MKTLGVGAALRFSTAASVRSSLATLSKPTRGSGSAQHHRVVLGNCVLLSSISSQSTHSLAKTSRHAPKNHLFLEPSPNLNQYVRSRRIS